MFFRFVRAAALLMFVLFLEQLPCMIGNYQGGGLNTFPSVDLSMISRLMKLSVANQQKIPGKIVYEGSKEYKHALSARRLLVGWDMVSVLTILGFLLWWEYQSQVKLLHNKDVYPKRFTIIAKNLP